MIVTAPNHAEPTTTTTAAIPSRRSVGLDVALALLCAVTFTGWRAVGVGGFSVRYGLAAIALCLTWLLAGHFMERLLRFRRPFDFPVRFVVGFFLANTALYVLVWSLPFGVIADFWIVAAALAAGTIALLRQVRTHDRAPATPGAWLPPVLCVLISLVAATLWSQDSLTPIVRDGGPTVVLRPWADSTFHASEIADFARSHGPSTIQEPRMAGARQRVTYHYACYIPAAFLTAAGHTPAIFSFACFCVPLGVFLTGVAAYALVRWWWGAWPAAAACAALLLTPDAAMQGFDNAFLSYHWRPQVAVGTAYGLAVVALAWVVMFEACRTRRFSLVLLSFVALATGLVYKSHMVLPSSLLLWVYPAMFMPRIPRLRRVVWGIAALAIFFAAIVVSQRSPSVPVIRLDFSATKPYLTSITRMFEPADGLAARAFTRFTPNTSLAHDLAWGAPMLFLCTFGIGGLAYLVLAVTLRRRLPVPVLLLPLAMIAMYLLMALGLAYDDRHVGTPEELLHRPFPWAYLVVYAWVGGASYYAIWRDAPPVRAAPRVALGCLLAGLIAVPAVAGRGIQAGPSRTWGIRVTDRSFDAGLVACATYVRDYDRDRRAVLQDSAGDPLLVVAALSEAQPYASAYTVEVRAPAGLVERLEEVKRLPEFRDARDVRKFATDRGIAWYLLRPGDKVNWPARFLSHPAYQSHGYRVYRFNVPSPPSSSKSK